MSQTLYRSRKYGVGKEIGGAVYVHRRYEDVFGDAVAAAKVHLPAGFEYQVVKSVARTGNISFVASPDFDTAHETIVGEILTVRPSGILKRRRQLDDPYIYHHKWLFVSDDYDGFDVGASKSRSERWMDLTDVDRTRIGRKRYWEEQVLPRLAHSDQE